MSISANEVQAVIAQEVTITADTLTIDLDDGRTISVPLTWYPRLWHGTPEERENWRFIGDGVGIHWPELDDDISIEGLLRGPCGIGSQLATEAVPQMTTRALKLSRGRIASLIGPAVLSK